MLSCNQPDAHHGKLKKKKASGSLRRHFERNVEVTALNLRFPCFCRERDDAASAQLRNHKRRQKPTAKYNKHWYADRRWQRVSGGEKQFPSQKPFKPDGVNREGGQEGKTQGEFLFAFAICCSFIFGGFTRSHTFGPCGADNWNRGSLTFSPDNSDTLTKWKHADFHAVKWFSGGWPSLSLWTSLLQRLGCHDNQIPVQPINISHTTMHMRMHVRHS